MRIDLTGPVGSIRQFAARLWREAPLTALMMVGVVALYVIKIVGGSFWAQGPEAMSDVLGEVGELANVRLPQLKGPFELWNGQWWRIPVSGLHHAGIVHLVSNVLFLAMMGLLLEPRMPKIAYLFFFTTSIAVSLLPEYLMEHYAIGISGGLCALFGVLLVVRRYDDAVRATITASFVRELMFVLVAFIPITLLGFVRVANVAHFTGLAYGWLTGEVFYGRWRGRRVPRWAFFAGHLLLLPLFVAVTHPVWIGRYQWYEALRAARRGDWTIYKKDLKRAVAIDPSLTEAWSMLAQFEAFREHDVEAAWRTVLVGLWHNEANRDLAARSAARSEGAETARLIFQNLRTPEQRADALDALREIFGNDAESWQQRLTEAAEPQKHARDRTPRKAADSPSDGSAVGRTGFNDRANT